MANASIRLMFDAEKDSFGVVLQLRVRQVLRVIFSTAEKCHQQIGQSQHAYQCLLL